MTIVLIAQGLILAVVLRHNHRYVKWSWSLEKDIHRLLKEVKILGNRLDNLDPKPKQVVNVERPWYRAGSE